ncbi:MAG TPA: dihydrolipoamide acetyltransferase family protein [Candidatus Thermoplasmatota archaeon]|nr:dihydrolipoamide acetyltransferase family protein [Candidatus Thermoplasmatota archaeon]
MVFQFKLPDIGEGVHEGEIVEWHVAEGDPVKEDQKMVEVMTDKATVVITSPRTGKVSRLLAKPGQVVKVGDVIVEIEVGPQADRDSPRPAGRGVIEERKATEGTKPTEPAAGPAAAQEEKTLFDLPSDLSQSRKRPAAAKPGASPASPARAPQPASAAVASVKVEHPAGRPLAAPAVRWKAREMGLDLERVAGSGPMGRIRMEDLGRSGPGGGSGSGASAGATASLTAALVAVPPIVPHPTDERVPIRGLRKAIFENMQRSEHHAVPFTYWDECDVTDLVKLRADARGLAERQGVKLSYLPFIVKAVVAGLKQFPTINAVMDEHARELVVRKHFHVGIATATDRGLTVVVVRDADQKSIFQIASEIDALAAKAREGKASREDLVGSTFTITSLGKDGGLGATPVLNHPEVGILGVHKIEPRAVVDPDSREVVARDRMNLSATFDHRVIDGHVGAAFLQEVIRLLSQPQLLLLGTA